MCVIKTVLLSGYKNHELGIWDEESPHVTIIKEAIESRLRSLIDGGLEWVIIGGQMGVELWGADVLLALKKEFPHVKLGVLMPFLNQEKKWKEERQEQYRKRIDAADFAEAVSKRPYEAPWQFKARDAFALSHTDALLLVYDEEQDGSPKFLKQAAELHGEKEDYPIYMITMDDLRAAAEEWQERQRPDF